MNESEFEAELRQVRPAPASSRLAERVADQLQSELPIVSQNPVPLSPERRVHAANPASALLDLSARRESTVPGWNLWRGLVWAVAGAASAIAILFARAEFSKYATTREQSASQTGPIALNEDPDESVAELVETEDEGLVYDSGDPQPQRQLRLRYLERHTWTNPQSGTVIEFEVPREDVVWMPVAMQ